MNKTIFVAILVASMALGAVACSSDPTPTPSGPSLTSEDVQAALSQALAAIPTPPPGVTAEEVEEIARRAAEQAASAGLTMAEVQQAIADALAPKPPELEPIKLVSPTNSSFALSTNGAADAGVFRKWGFDPVDRVFLPFPGFVAAFATRQSEVGNYSGTTAIRRIAGDGQPWVIIGGGLTVMQNVYVPVDSPIQTVEDLRGKKLGVWSRTSGALEALRIIWLEEYGIDLFDPNDIDLVVAAPPVLFALAEQGEVDAQFQLSSLTVRAASRPDEWRELFSPNVWWQERTGQPLVWAAPVVAWRDWVSEDVDRARRLVSALHESFDWLAEPANLRTAVAQYGELAGVVDQAQADVYERWLGEGRIYLSKWDQETIDIQWEFLELAQKHGVIEDIPPKGVAARALVE